MKISGFRGWLLEVNTLKEPFGCHDVGLVTEAPQHPPMFFNTSAPMTRINDSETLLNRATPALCVRPAWKNKQIQQPNLNM